MNLFSWHESNTTEKHGKYSKRKRADMTEQVRTVEICQIFASQDLSFHSSCEGVHSHIICPIIYI